MTRPGRLPGHLDATFAALADPTRRAILARLAQSEASVMELAAPFAISQPAISKHLKVLERAGLISRGRDAQRRPCRIEPRALAEANGWLETYRAFWEASFDRLEALLGEPDTGGTNPADDRLKTGRSKATRPDDKPARGGPTRDAPARDGPARRTKGKRP